MQPRQHPERHPDPATFIVNGTHRRGVYLGDVLEEDEFVTRAVVVEDDGTRYPVTSEGCERAMKHAQLRD